jgi:hypothetical protein
MMATGQLEAGAPSTSAIRVYSILWKSVSKSTR